VCLRTRSSNEILLKKKKIKLCINKALECIERLSNFCKNTLIGGGQKLKTLWEIKLSVNSGPSRKQSFSWGNPISVYSSSFNQISAQRTSKTTPDSQVPKNMAPRSSFRALIFFSNNLFSAFHFIWCRSQRPRGLRRGSAAARLLRLWVRIPPGARISVCCERCVLSGRGLCDGLITRPEESYRLWCVVVCDLETSWMRRPWPNGGLSRQKQTNKHSIWQDDENDCHREPRD